MPAEITIPVDYMEEHVLFCGDVTALSFTIREEHFSFDWKKRTNSQSDQTLEFGVSISQPLVFQTNDFVHVSEYDKVKDQLRTLEAEISNLRSQLTTKTKRWWHF